MIQEIQLVHMIPAAPAPAGIERRDVQSPHQSNHKIIPEVPPLDPVIGASRPIAACVEGIRPPHSHLGLFHNSSSPCSSGGGGYSRDKRHTNPEQRPHTTSSVPEQPDVQNPETPPPGISIQSPWQNVIRKEYGGVDRKRYPSRGLGHVKNRRTGLHHLRS